MLFTIILPVYNRIQLTQITLQELSTRFISTGNLQFRIIVIDDGSSDGTQEWIKENFPEVVILRGDGNLWWSGAVNQGARYAIEVLRSDYLILWNNDVTMDQNYVECLNEIIMQSDLPDIIGSKILVREHPEYIWSVGGCFNPYTGQYYMYGYFQRDGEKYEKIFYPDWLTGMGTIIHKKVIQTNGYWDNLQFPQYHGDSDFTYRAKLSGFNMIVHPKLRIYNSVKVSGIEHSGNVKKLLRLMTDLRSKSNFKQNLRFYRRHARSIRAYYPFIMLYLRIFGGFLKWKLLNLIGIKRQNTYQK